MSIFTITGKDKEDFKVFFSQDTYECIGKNGYYTMAATDDEDFVAGVLQFYVGEDYTEGITAKITYLYVDEDFRREGIATSLISAFQNTISQSGIELATVEVFENAGEELSNIFEEAGFLRRGEVSYYCLPLLNLCKKAAVKNAATGRCRSIAELDTEEKASFFNSINPSILKNGLKDYDLEVSSYYLEDDKKCLLLIRKEEEGVLETVFMYASEGNEKNLVSLLSYSANRAKEMYGPACTLQIICNRPLEYDLISKVAPDLTADKYTLYMYEKANTPENEGMNIMEYI